MQRYNNDKEISDFFKKPKWVVFQMTNQMTNKIDNTLAGLIKKKKTEITNIKNKKRDINIDSIGTEKKLEDII